MTRFQHISTLNRFRLTATIALTLILGGCASNQPSIDSANTNLTSYSSDVSAKSSQECVVLIHGLWRSAFAMRSIESSLQDQGYKTVNISYPSTSITIPEIADQFVKPAVENCQSQSDTTHIVTHSMGGIVARAYLQNHRLNEESKVVMLSPPNQGSELSNKFHDEGWFSFFAGSAATTLHSQENGLIKDLKPVPEQVGIIAGFRGWSLWPESWLPSPNDGMVSVESMKMEGMDDFIMVNTGHAMMRYREAVQEQIIVYLNEGNFDHSKEDQISPSTPSVANNL